MICMCLCTAPLRGLRACQSAAVALIDALKHDNNSMSAGCQLSITLQCDACTVHGEAVLLLRTSA